MPHLRSLSRTAMREHPELIEITGFRRSPERHFLTFYETVNNKVIYIKRHFLKTQKKERASNHEPEDKI